MIPGDIERLAQRLGGGQLFIQSDLQGAVSAQYGHFQVKNPTSSGKELVVIAFVINPASAMDLQISTYDTDLTVDSGALVNLNLGGTAASSHMFRQANAGILGTIVGRCAASASPSQNVMRLPAKLPPGKGLCVSAGTVNVALRGTVWALER